IEFDLRARDVAARGNFCTVDAQGRITDRRAGRIGTEVCVRLTERLRAIRLPGVEVFVEPVKEHRFVLVLRGPRLSGRLSETDPQVLGKPPLPVRALEPAAGATADLVNRFVTEAGRLLHDAAPANLVPADPGPLACAGRAPAPRPRCSRATAGSRSRRSCGAATAAPIPSPHSPSGRARRAASARSPRITSCRSSWPTPRG